MKKYLLPLVVVVACMACEKTIEIDVPLEDSKLVLLSYLNPDSTLRSRLNSSIFVLDEMKSRSEVAGATIVVFEDDKEVGCMAYSQNGWYELPGFKPKEGKVYRLKSEKAGFNKISVSEKVFEAVAIGPVTVDTVFEQQNG